MGLSGIGWRPPMRVHLQDESGRKRSPTVKQALCALCTIAYACCCPAMNFLKKFFGGEKPIPSERPIPPSHPEPPAAAPSAAFGPWRARPIFISSTFRDMHAERGWLQERVFPALEERLRGHRPHLEIIDLRQGVET